MMLKVQHLCTLLFNRWAVMFALFFFILISALSVVYATFSSRHLYHQLQEVLSETSSLEEQYGKLLLERGVLRAPRRIETLAVQQLKMHVPINFRTLE